MSRARYAVVTGVVLGSTWLGSGCGNDQPASTETSWNNPVLIDEGRDVFRYETFGDETYWTGTLRLNEVISEVLTPRMALTLGLKVDADALPDGLIATADLEGVATTIALLKVDAIVGLKATVVTDAGGRDTLAAVGVTCALCHSTVDDSLAPGIGHRLDGWANSDLDPGAIIARSPTLTSAQKIVYSSWGPGRFDLRYNLDGINAAVVIPPAYGLKDAPHAAYTGDGDIRYWTNYVAVTQMGGHGRFVDERIGVDRELSGNGYAVDTGLEPLRSYQFSLDPPAPPAGSTDGVAAGRGHATFDQHCARCHAADRGFSNEDLFGPGETGMDPVHADRSATKAYRATPLRALWQHAPYFHDGSGATLEVVVDHYDSVLKLGLAPCDKSDLIAYLKTL